MNYAPFGGGQLTPESPECAIRDHYDANNLMVFYTDPKRYSAESERAVRPNQR